MAAHRSGTAMLSNTAEMRIQRVGLEHHREIAGAGTNPVNGDTLDADFARCLRLGTRNDAQQCRLAARLSCAHDGPMSSVIYLS